MADRKAPNGYIFDIFGFGDEDNKTSDDDLNVFDEDGRLEKKIKNKKDELVRKKNIAIWSVVYYFAVVLAYLTVSLTVKDSWNWSWLILAIGMILSFAYFSLERLRTKLQKNSPSYWETLLNTIVLTVMTITLIVFAVFAKTPEVWRYLLIAAMPTFALNSALGYVLRSKGRFFYLLANVMIISVLLYATLCLFNAIPWSPSWLIILGGALIDSIIIAVKLTVKKN